MSFTENLNMLKEQKNISQEQANGFLYASSTERNLDRPKNIDLKIGTAHELVIEKTDGDKIQVIAASNKLSFTNQQVKVKFNESKRDMDIVVKHTSDLSDLASLENLFILVRIPEKFVADIELNAELENLEIRDIVFDSIEFDGKVKNVFVANISGHIELNTNSNINLKVNGAKGKIDLNHLHAVSKISFVEGQNYYLKNAGRFTRFVDSNANVIFGKREKHDPHVATDLIVELNGWKSEAQILQEA